MYIEQIYTNCLAEASYYVESNGEAAIIDPIRDIEIYTKLAYDRGSKIKYIFETHFHADFVSGHIDLAEETGAEIIFGPLAKAEYKMTVAEDGQLFKLGSTSFKTLHTPGHTMESTTWLLQDYKGSNHAIFTGDTLFIGDVGRPDLAVTSDMTEKYLAGHLYDSLKNKIKPLEDHVIVYPAHGAGSPCGKALGDETVSTVGEQKKTNYAMQEMPKEKFIEVLLDGLSSPPSYFPENARLNKVGYKPFNNVKDTALHPLSLEKFENEIKNGAVIIDTRDQSANKGIIPNSLNIQLNGQFAIWVGSLVKIDSPVVLVTDSGKEKESVIRMTRVGFDNIRGYLDGGFETWKNAEKKYDEIKLIHSHDLPALLSENAVVLDVRQSSEVNVSHVEGATNIPLDELEKRLMELEKDTNYLVHCVSGYRSMIASSILKRNGFDNFYNVVEGFHGILEDGKVSLVEGPCAVTERKIKYGI
jgi:glyoxylase-like metal-dependent hydrolase (beta-lactamase superfamily II)/rhodanese-related sulfurtransferase